MYLFPPFSVSSSWISSLSLYRVSCCLFSGARLKLVMLSGARIVKQPGDNSCLFHSLSFLLSYHDIVSFISEMSSGFELRASFCSFIRDKPLTYIVLSDGLISTIEDALTIDNFSILAYSEHMSSLQSWGGSLEIATVAEMFSIGISVYLPCSTQFAFTLLGSYRCLCFGSGSKEICLLYSGYCHYDCLVDCEIVASCPVNLISDFSSSNLSSIIRNYDLSLEQSLLSIKRSLSPLASYPSRRLSTVVDVVAGICPPPSPSSPRPSRALPAPLVSDQSYAYVNIVAPKPKSRVRKSSRSAHPMAKLLPAVAKLNRLKRIGKLLSYRLNKPSFRKPLSKIAKDCASYAQYYDEGSQFIVCAICGVEGSRSGSVSKDDIESLILSSGIKNRFISLTTASSSCSFYDMLYIEQLLLYFDNGLIRHLSSICGLCCQQMKGKRSFADNILVDDVEDLSDVEDDADDINIISSPCVAAHLDLSSIVSDCLIPKLALFLGIFPGCVPDVLVGLTPVEESMITIYSAVSKITLARGGHYKVKSSTTYTIINDLTSVSKQLPRMPSIEGIAIIRHKNTPVGKEYTYRPYRVFSALTWLKVHNFLYSDIELVWGDDVRFWQNTQSAIDIPFIEISDQEVSDIDDELFAEPCMSDDMTTNSGT